MPAHPSLYFKKSVYDAVCDYSLEYKIDSDMLVRIFNLSNTHYK